MAGEVVGGGEESVLALTIIDMWLSPLHHISGIKEPIHIYSKSLEYCYSNNSENQLLDTKDIPSLTY